MDYDARGPTIGPRAYISNDNYSPSLSIIKFFVNKLPVIIIMMSVLAALLPACNKDDDTQSALNKAYTQWHDLNQSWLNEQKARRNADGTPYYTTVVPSWNPAAFVLIHYYNDTTLTSGNLSPLYTSTIDTRYMLRYYNGTAIDSSYNQTKYGPGIFRTRLDEVIDGWAIAFQTMHVGDTAEIIIPYEVGYGVSSSSGVLPYSNLVFNVRLVDIPYYETSPK